MDERTEIFINNYKRKKENYRNFADLILDKIKSALSERGILIAYSSARGKSVESLTAKCEKTVYNKETNHYTLKYDNPSYQIMDLSGVRIVAYLNSDVAKISKIIESLFKIDRENSGDKIDDFTENEIGYLSVHYIVSLDNFSPEQRKYDGMKCEVQIRTVLQDAWAQIFHDRYYKSNFNLIDAPEKLKRHTNLIAGSLELIDNQITEIVNKYDEMNFQKLSDKKLQNLLDSEINEKNLVEYCKLKFENSANRFFDSESVLSKISKFNIISLRDLDNLIQDDFVSKIDLMNQITIDKMINYILIIKDYKQFFNLYGDSINITKEGFNLLNSFINMDTICNELRIQIP